MPLVIAAGGAGGSKSWVKRVMIDGERRDIDLGGWPLTSLKETRERAFANRKLARDAARTRTSAAPRAPAPASTISRGNAITAEFARGTPGVGFEDGAPPLSVSASATGTAAFARQPTPAPDDA